MEPGPPDGDPFWTQFCGTFQPQTLFNPSLLLWAGPPPPAAGFSCRQHFVSLALTSLLALCTMSHILTLRTKKYPSARGRSESSMGGGIEAGQERKEEVLQTIVRVKWPFWAGLVASFCLGLGWGGFSVWMALSSATTTTTIGQARLDQVSFAAGQALGWFVMAAAFWACQSRQIPRAFSTARLFMVMNAVQYCALASVCAHRLAEHGSWSTSFPSLEDSLVIVSLPSALFFGLMGLLGSVGLQAEPVVRDPFLLHEPLLPQEEVPREEPKLCETVTAYGNAGFFGTALFSFSVPVLERGADTVLTPDDIPQLRPDDRSSPVFERFDAIMRRLQGRRPERAPPLALAIFCTFYPILFVTAWLNLLQTCFLFIGPLLIPKLVEHVGAQGAMNGDGVLLAFILLCASVLGSISGTQQNFKGELLGLNLQSALTGELYKKGLRLSAKARQESSVGEIVNLMSTDVQRLKEICWELNNIWVLPLQIVVALVILYRMVGISMLAGLGVMLGIMIINLLVANQQRHSVNMTMECRDERMKATTEALKSMRIIKLYAWQDQFEKHITGLRNTEVHWLTRFMYICAVNIFLLWLSPLAVAVGTFGTMTALGKPLTPGAVFSALATFRILQEPLRSFPTVISAVTQALVSLNRLKEFLGSSELQQDAITRLTVIAPPRSSPVLKSPVGTGGELAVEVEDASFSWENDSGNMTLEGVTLRIKRGARVAICGPVGAGKSSFLSCLLGEVPKLQGTVRVWGSLAYVPQSAWIQSCTVKENILFGKPYEEERYKETLRCACLDKDIALFSHGDETVIGERGVNLSGGQKQRIQLARALYHGADTFLLDDPFSAVDAHTGSELFMEYILGGLQGKTVILVTHQVEFLPAADIIVVLKEGKVVQSGTYEELRGKGTDFEALVEAHEEALKSVDSASQLHKDGDEQSEAESTTEYPGSPPDSGLDLGNGHTWNRKTISVGEGSEEEEGDESEMTAGGQLIQDEEVETGHVSSKVYWAYVTKVLGGALVPVLFIVQTAWQGLDIGSNYLLADYTSGRVQWTGDEFLRIYSLLALGSGAFVFVRTILISWAGLAITQGFFCDMLRSVFRAPMSFFDKTPLGRILARSSTDQATLDLDVPFSFGSFLAMCFSLLGTLFVCSFVTWPVLYAVIPLAYLYVSFKEYYLASSRELTRLNGVSKAPIIEHFGESLAGATVIRAFEQTERFAAKSNEKVDINNRIYFHYGATTMWTAVHLQLIGGTLLGFTALMLVSLPSSFITPGLAGMSLSYGLALADSLFFVVWVWCALENEMVSVERIQQYSELPSEKTLALLGTMLPTDWPYAGHIVFENVQVRYREDMPLVLKGITLDIPAGSKLGVVGRTGSGKSTLVAALFRIVEPSGGDISIDGVNILTEVGLADLRSRLSIIPQEPTLFEGTVRYNLDPMNLYTDADIWEALEKCQLSLTIESGDNGLDASVVEGGENWSVGQRQLFCLGRALLKKSRVLVLDEATASVDTKTDALIQKTIRENFGECTVMSIAHRIPTVIDSDRVLVMEEGEAAEYATPGKLLADPSSRFSKLVQEYSTRSSELAEVARSSSVETFTAQ